jgi:hypothetical protein
MWDKSMWQSGVVKGAVFGHPDGARHANMLVLGECAVGARQACGRLQLSPQDSRIMTMHGAHYFQCLQRY